MELEINSKEPIYIQIKDYIKTKIVSGELNGGDRLLSVREYASELKVNPNTISRVYSELESENLIVTKRGIGKFVTESMPDIEELKNQYSRKLISDFIKKTRTIGLDKNQIIKLLNEMYKEE